jgi:hypothetical protein
MLIRNLTLTCEIKNNAINNFELQNLHLVIMPTTTNLHGISITHGKNGPWNYNAAM